MFFFSRFLLTGFEIGACRSEEHNNRVKGKKKQGYYFHRYHFHAITVDIKSHFEQCTNKKKRINTNENNFSLIKNEKPKDKILYSKSLAKMKY